MDWSALSDRAESGRQEVYAFSLPPWHSVEILTPRPFGEPFPVHRRLSVAIPGEGRMWTPSIYSGIVVAFAILIGLAHPREAFSDGWLWLAIASLMLSFGHFGAVWVLQQIPGALEQTESAMGGPYWLLQHLPGYSAFRYPTKWLPLFAVGTTMFAARWISTPRVPSTASVLLVSVACLTMAVVCQVAFDHGIRSERQYVDEYWGPLDWQGGWWVARNSWLVSLVGLLAIARLRSESGHWSAFLLVVLCAIDCGWNAFRMLPTVSVAEEQRLCARVEVASDWDESSADAVRVLRTQSREWPRVWSKGSSTDRALEVAVSERIAWFGRWHLYDRVAVFNSTTSIRSKALASFWMAANRKQLGMTNKERQDFWELVRRWLAIDTVCHVDGKTSIRESQRELVSVYRKRNREVQPIRGFSEWQEPMAVKQVIEQLAAGIEPAPSAAIEPTEIRSTYVEVVADGWASADVRSDHGCLIERNQFQDGHWIAVLESRRGDRIERSVFPSGVLKQAVVVPPGDWRVEFRYRPWWKWPTVFLTLGSVLVWCSLFIANHKRPISVV